MDLTKMFVLVPSTSVATVESIKTASLSSNKIYFMAKYNQIVAKGAVYGVDPSTGKELETLVSVLGGSKGADGTVKVDFSNLNYYTSEGTKTIIGAIEAIDAALKAEMDKLGNSKTLNENWEFTGKLMYVAAVPASEGKEAVPARIAIADETGTEIAGTSINVSDIIGNGVLKTSAYDAATGILTLTFAQADGTEKAIGVDLKAMLDINDISIDEASKKYLEVTLGTASAEGDTQAVFGAKIVKVAEATDAKTGLVDAKDVKDYVDSKATDLSVEAQGDAYVSASIDPTNNKKVIVATNKQDVSASAGTRGTWAVSDAGVATLSGETAPSISGVANSLMDGEQAINAVKTYIDAVVAAEAAERVAKISAAVKALDKASATVDGSNVHVAYKEEDGIVTIESVTEDYATVTRVATTSVAGTPKTDASLTVTVGDEEKLVKAKDLKAVADYAADKVTEEAHRVDKKIAETIDGLDVTETPVSEKGEGAINFKYSETNGKIAINNLSVTYATHSANTVTTGIVTGTVLNDVLADMWETYVDA